MNTSRPDSSVHRERHRSYRSPWLRAAVLGVNDGIVSTASLMLGVAAANASIKTILTAGIAGLMAGALSMAAGEYVCVSSQRDSEKTDLDIEARELKLFAKEELQELTDIYIKRGLEPKLAAEVAKQLHEHDALAAHARDELGIDHEALSNPMQASVSSAVSFAFGAALPIMGAILFRNSHSSLAIVLVSILALGLSGAIGARIGGGNKLVAAIRVIIGGGLAMLITAIIGHLVGGVI